MSVESMARALNLVDERLSPTDKLLLVGIANHDGDGGAWPSVATLARYCGITARNVQKHLALLESFGYLRREIGAGGTPKTPKHERPSLYHLSLATPPVAGDTSPPVAQDTPPPVAGDTRTVLPEPSIEPSPVTHSHNTEVVPAEVVGGVEDFEVFWALYGRIGSKVVAKQAWTKAIATGAAPQDIIEGLEKWIGYWKSPGAAKVKWPQGWLNERRWEVDPPMALAQVQRPVNKGLASVARARAALNGSR
jgi:hypothetical protein